MLQVWTRRAAVAAAVSVLAVTAATKAADAPQDVSAELAALKARIAQLESQQGDNWMTKERESQIKKVVDDVLKDAKSRGDFLGGAQVGYSSGSGFFIQSPDGNNKLNISGFVQARYEYAYQNAFNGRHFTRTIPASLGSSGSGNAAVTITQPDPGNSSGFDIRRARVSFSGNIFSKDLTFKLEGDFYGNSTGNFTITDAFVAYRFDDALKVKVGSYKVPFAKAELMSDTVMQFAERPEELVAFDPVRALGVSLYGDLVKDQLSYEFSVNDGGSSNTLRQDDTVGLAANLDNRMGYYGRLQWAGAGKISDFAEEPDLRDDPKDFIWMLGLAGGYESQNATNYSYPSPQSSTSIKGLSNAAGTAGFAGNYALNGDVYRATLDWSAKYQGLSVNVAGYFQEINVNPGNVSSTSGTTIGYGPYGAGKTSFFQWGGYGQIGYFVVPQKLEIVARAGVLGTEGAPNIGQFYTLGANYYVYKHNFKIVGDVTYIPEAPYTDAASSLLQNSQDIVFRLQAQLKF
jgi:hypothetical protein